MRREDVFVVSIRRTVRTLQLKVLFALLWWCFVSASADDDRLDGIQVHHEYTGDSVIDVVQRRGLLKVGVGLFEPWVMCDTQGDLIGFEIDVSRKLAEEMRVRIQHVRTDWYFIVPSLIEEKYDVVISGMSVTPDRSLLINFSIPSAESGIVIVANVDLSENLQSIEDFNESSVIFGARAGSVTVPTISRLFPNAILSQFDSDKELLDALLAGQIHAAATNQFNAVGWTNDHTDLLSTPFDELLDKSPEAIGLRKGDFDGVNFFNSWIEHHKSSGWLQERREYWFESRDWEDLVATNPDTLASCAESFR